MRKIALIGSFLHLIIPLVSAVSLADFQQLTVEVSVSCAIAYDRTIPSCTNSDFTNGAACSSGCVSGLNQIANGVIESCGGVVVGSSTLLGRIFNGAIVSSLCPNNGKSTSSAQKQSTTAAPATTAQSTVQPSVAKTSSTKASVVTSSSSSTSAASSSSSATAQSSSSSASTASSSTTAAAASSVSSSTTSSAAAQTSTSQSQAQSGNGKSGMTVQQQQIAAMANSGGGSPFDIVGYSSASRLSQKDLVSTAIGLALLLAGILLR
jgi:hypothetical protein